MELQQIGWRDWFPKRGLEGKFIGDRYPLCEDLPPKAFLRFGAKYRLLGGSTALKWQKNDVDWDVIGSKRFVLDPTSSALYQKLCAPENGVCTYPSVVTLDENLACSGKECNVDTIRALVSIRFGVALFYGFLNAHSLIYCSKLHQALISSTNTCKCRVCI